MILPLVPVISRVPSGVKTMFETIDDGEIARSLLNAAARWLRARGRTAIMGPIDYSTNYVCGLLVDGFQFPPTLLTGHNPAYYESLVEGCGFTKVIDFYAWWFSEPAHAAESFFPSPLQSISRPDGRDPAL